MQSASDESDIDKTAIAVTKALQTRTNIGKEERKFQKNANVGRRNTVANLMKAQTKKLNNDEPYNLEKQFRKSFAKLSKTDTTVQPSRMPN